MRLLAWTLGLAVGLAGAAPGAPSGEFDLSAFACADAGGERLCRRSGDGTGSMEGATVRAIVLALRDGELARVSWAFDENAFDRVRRQLAQRLGPGEAGTELLKAGMGGVFPNRFVVWRHDGQVWLLEQYFERVIHSALTRMSPQEFDRLWSHRERLRVRGARDL